MSARKKIFLFFTVLLVASLACQVGSVAPTTTPTPIPTNTAKPAPTAAPAVFELDTQVYTHSLGAFSMRPPAGWTLDDSDAGGTVTWFFSPDEKAAIAVTVINTGYELDDQAFANYVEAREYFFFENRFGAIDVVGKDVQSDFAGVEKSFSLNGTPQHCATLYYKVGQAVYSIDYFSDEDVMEEYFAAFPQVTDTFTPIPEGIANLGLYNSFYTFTDEQNLYTIQVPAWNYEHSTGTDINIDTFSSPDGAAGIQTVVLNMNQTVTQSLAGQAALLLLNEYYTSGAGDIKISKDIPLPNSRERLEWRSQKSGLEGVTVFESRDNYLILFSVLYDGKVKDVFADALNVVLDTYQPVE